MKNLFKSWLLLALITIGFVACETTDPIVEDEGQAVSVSFNLKSLDPAAKVDNSKAAAKWDYGTKFDGSAQIYPDCTEDPVSYIEATIDGVIYQIQMTALPYITEAVQLDMANPLLLTELIAYNAAGVEIYEAPQLISDEVVINGLTGVTLELKEYLKSFTKTQVNVDIICYNKIQHKNLTWGWFGLHKYEKNTLCFFGDVCSKFYEDFGADGYDFPAEFSVIIYNGDGSINSQATTATTQGNWINTTGAPLCVEYLDDSQNDQEGFTYDLILHTPTGDIVLEDGVSFNDGTHSDGTSSGFGGENGISLFNVGNCGTNNDGVNYTPYFPVPNQLQLKRTSDPFASARTNYWDVFFRDINGGVSSSTLVNLGLSDGAVSLVQDGWCGELGIPQPLINHWYKADVYNSLTWDFNSNPIEDLDSNIKTAKLNFIVNNFGSSTELDIQNAIWYILGSGSNNNTLAQTASGITTYIPPVGGYAVVASVPYAIYLTAGEIIDIEIDYSCFSFRDGFTAKSGVHAFTIPSGKSGWYSEDDVIKEFTTWYENTNITINGYSYSCGNICWNLCWEPYFQPQPTVVRIDP